MEELRKKLTIWQTCTRLQLQKKRVWISSLCDTVLMLLFMMAIISVDAHNERSKNRNVLLNEACTLMTIYLLLCFSDFV